MEILPTDDAEICKKVAVHSKKIKSVCVLVSFFFPVQLQVVWCPVHYLVGSSSLHGFALF